MARLMQKYRRGPFDPKPEREKIELPLSVLPYQAYEPAFRSIGYRDRLKSREYTPYQPGDILFVNIGTTRMPEIRVAKVYICHSEWQEGNSWYIPKWKVQLATKDGFWSQQWRYCWPGDVYRAYHGETDDQVRSLPMVINMVSDLCPVGEIIA